MRGWTPEAFARAKPEFMEAVRFGLFAERASAILATQREIRDVRVDRNTPDLPTVLGAKNTAAELIPLIEDVLYPKDEADGR